MIWGGGALLGAGVGWLVWRVANLRHFAEYATRSGPRKTSHPSLEIGAVVISAVNVACLVASRRPIGETTATIAIGTFLLLIAVLDLRYTIVPNALVYPAACVLFLGHLLLFGVEDAMIALCAGAGSFVFFMLVSMISPGGLGGGDIKLAALVGLLVGFPAVLWALALAILAGGIMAIVMLSLGRRGPMPYAPYLCLGAWVALLWDPLPWILMLARVATV